MHHLPYVRQSLSPGEELLYVGEFHWMYTFNAIMCIVWGAIGTIISIVLAVNFEARFGGGMIARDWLGMVRELHPAIRLGAFLVFIMGLVRFAQMMVVRSSTEIAITNSRVIFKRGLVARYVGEISIDRIEGVNVLQSFWGRVLGYGRILIRGMGVGEVILPPLRDPIAFRKAIEMARTT